MGDKETFTEKTLQRIRTGEQTQNVTKKRKLSRLILVIDAVFILLILIFFFGKNDRDKYYSTTLKYDDISFRFTLNRESGKNNSLFMLTLKLDNGKQKTFHFRKSVGQLSISDNGTNIFSQTFAEGVTQISLLPDEVKSFAIPVDHRILDRYIESIPSLVERSRPSLLSPGGSGVPLKARVIINLPTSVATEIEFMHEVSR